MIIDSHQHVMLPLTAQLAKLDEAGVDKAVLFTTVPHPERAKSAALADISEEMQALYRLLEGSFSPEERIRQMRGTIREAQAALAQAPDRFIGAFCPVPLGMTDEATSAWVAEQALEGGFVGLGEFTCGSADQMRQLEAVFKASAQHGPLPLWVHTFDPVDAEGLRVLMELTERFAPVPVIFGHGGGYRWMEALVFVKKHANAWFDLSAVFTPLSARSALFEVPERCLFGSDAPYGEPKLARQLIEHVSATKTAADAALGENLERLLRLA